MTALAPLAAVVAVARNRCIGKSGGHLGLPWHIPEDLKHFKALTTGHAVIFGRKTYETIGRPLPNRRNIVVSANRDFQAAGVEVVPDLATAIALARAGGDPEPRICGGATIYRQAFPLLTKLYLTEVNEDFEGDTFFPQWDPAEWVETERRKGDDPRVTFVTLSRQ